MQPFSPIGFRIPEIPIDGGIDQFHEEWRLRFMPVAQNVHSEVPVRQKQFDGAVAFDLTAMIDDPDVPVEGRLPGHAVPADSRDFGESPRKGGDIHCRTVEFIHGLRPEQTFILVHPPVHVQLQPEEHFSGTGVDTGSGTGNIHLPGIHLREYAFTFFPEISHSPVIQRAHLLHGQAAALHPERPEDAFAYELFPGAAGGNCCNVPCQRVHGIVILGAAAERTVRFQKAHAMYIFLRRQSRFRPHGVVCGKAGAVIQHVTQGTLL